ncbi:Ger(x)C family spore germination protein [Paenibacillus arenilitoris]|uniref:Ger(X)C family spore germination protein n=1 Tax=Paenibacillus arenilitoris TaxID=2772299 RepID=A0A927H529_9BACL|nr:Ger(x)C family spore germination protein [Paenibacillus arenilitoris]MBD2868113.1 Ger(x)C family spore germination protein [Paenibacillus arenilitoris]
MGKIKPLAAAALIALLAGCGDQRVLESLAFVNATSYDLVQDKEDGAKENLLICIDVPKSDPEGKMKREVLSTVARSKKDAHLQLAKQTELMLVSGQLRSSLFGLSIARSGIWNYVRALVRDPSISQNVKVAVVNGNAGELLAKRYPEHPMTGQYIDRLLEKEADKMSVPRVTVYDFTRDFYDDGIDAVAPILKQGKKNIEVNGIALFDQDRYITRIEPDQMPIFALLRQNVKNGELSIDIKKSGEEAEQIMINSIVSRRKVKVRRGENGNFIVNIHFRVMGTLREYLGDLDMSDDRHRRELEKRVTASLLKDADAMVAMLRKHNVDSLGIGKRVRNSMSYKEWSKTDWNAVYPKLDIKVTGEMIIKDFGKVY